MITIIQPSYLPLTEDCLYSHVRSQEEVYLDFGPDFDPTADSAVEWHSPWIFSLRFGDRESDFKTIKLVDHPDDLPKYYPFEAFTFLQHYKVYGVYPKNKIDAYLNSTVDWNLYGPVTLGKCCAVSAFLRELSWSYPYALSDKDLDIVKENNEFLQLSQTLFEWAVEESVE
jgi:hypothetical protein